MEIKGTITQILTEQTGMGKKGQWVKQEYILSTPGQYPKKVCFSLWGEKIYETGLGLNEEVTVHIDLESREYNGRWYTEVRAWKVERGLSKHRPTQDAPSTHISDGVTDDLPF